MRTLRLTQIHPLRHLAEATILAVFLVLPGVAQARVGGAYLNTAVQSAVDHLGQKNQIVIPAGDDYVPAPIELANPVPSPLTIPTDQLEPAPESPALASTTVSTPNAQPLPAPAALETDVVFDMPSIAANPLAAIDPTPPDATAQADTQGESATGNRRVDPFWFILPAGVIVAASADHGSSFHATPAPEPASFTLLALTGILLRRKK